MGSKFVTEVIFVGFLAAVAFALLQRQTPVTDEPAVNTAPPSTPATPAPHPEGESIFVSNLYGHLVVVKDGVFKDFHASSLKGVKYWAFYYSATWCPPCHKFTPALVDFYKHFKPTHPNFELILVSHDQNETDMLTSMRDDGVPWPAVRYGDVKVADIDHYCGSGLPDLVLVDANGRLLSDSFNVAGYMGPEKVVRDIQTMVPLP